VEGLNKVMGDGHYGFIATGTIGRDAIKAGLLYQPALLTPQGRFALLDGKLDPRFNDALNRPALAQSFHQAGPGSVFTVVVTHLKSKNCAGAEGRNLDQQNGQGCFNATRTLAANALADWALRDPTGSGSKRVLLMGDFNSHRLEDPIRAVGQSGLVNLLARLGDASGYTYAYDGRTSTLDYAFASPQLLPFITGAAPWHINADELELLDYNLESGKPVFRPRPDHRRFGLHKTGPGKIRPRPGDARPQGFVAVPASTALSSRNCAFTWPALSSPMRIISLAPAGSASSSASAKR
jgi:predicted extracellular nuclease